MSRTEPPQPIKGKIYSMDEAVDLMKEMSNYATTQTIRWVDAKTKKPVTIGFNY